LTANNKVDRKALPAPDSTLASGAVHVAPRGQMDIQMAALWQQVFEIDKVGVHDNFFDLGGHSLKAAQLFHLIEQVYGRHLPLSTLFQAPTIATLTSVLAQKQWTPPWQSLVTLQPNGSAIPIFLVSAADGNVLYYAKLARLLGRTHPVYGLQARGFDGKAEPFGSVPEMAKQYIAEMSTCLPQGSCVIVGACTGGLVAYEMAQQLVEQGAAVTLIVMNSWPSTSYSSYYNTLPRRLALSLSILSMIMKTLGELRRRPTRDWLAVMQHRFLKLRSLFQRSNRLEQAMFRAAARYNMRTYPGRILNIVASKRITAQDTRYAWRELALGGCRTIDVGAGGMLGLLASPNVEEVSSHIQRFISDNSQDTPVRPNNRAA
jgi:thioesterase domain-containing protein/acyl carrier protein